MIDSRDVHDLLQSYYYKFIPNLKLIQVLAKLIVHLNVTPNTCITQFYTVCQKHLKFIS